MATYREVIARQLANGDYHLPPLYEALGMRLVSISDEYATVAMSVDAQLYNQRGTMQGGFIAALADAAIDLAWSTMLDEGQHYAALELKANFLRPVHQGRIVACAHVAHRGRTVGLVECDVTDEADKLLARVSCTTMNIS
jgi:uncharacterized protein (TIGR00369 family)